jgi:COMPASS component SWD3
VTTVRFSPNGRYILAFTLDSCIRLWDYVSGTCKKTYQGHENSKLSLSGTFGVAGTEAFIVSGSENGELLFWDVRTKEVVQRAEGHQGAVLWVDTCPGPSKKLVTGGMDGTVRIWVDVYDEEDIDGLKVEENSANEYGETADIEKVRIKVEDTGIDNDTPRDEMSVIGDRVPERSMEEPLTGNPERDKMEED